MKTFLTRVLPVLSLVAVLEGAASAQTVRIGTIDLSRAFTNYWKTKEASAALQVRKDEITKAEKELLDGLQKAQDEYRKLDADARDQAVSVEEREKRKKAAVDKLKDIDQMKADFDKYDRRVGTELSEQYMRTRENLLVEIRDVVNSRAKAGGFALVLDSAAQTPDRTQVVLYSTVEDLTDSVLAQMNANRPIEPPASPPKTSPTNEKSSPPDTKKPAPKADKN